MCTSAGKHLPSMHKAHGSSLSTKKQSNKFLVFFYLIFILFNIKTYKKKTSIVAHINNSSTPEASGQAEPQSETSLKENSSRSTLRWKLWTECTGTCMLLRKYNATLGTSFREQRTVSPSDSPYGVI